MAISWGVGVTDPARELRDFLRDGTDLAPDPSAWPALDERVVNLGLEHLVALNSNHLPPEMAERYQSAYRRNAALNALQCKELSSILIALGAKGVDVIVFKGAYLLDRFYKRLGARLMGDLDLLIHKPDLPQVKRVLVDLGFSRKDEHCSEEWFDSNYYRSALYRKGPVEVEIHWDLFHPDNPFNFNIGDVWAEARPATLYGAPALVMTDEMLLIYLCVHVSYSHFLNHHSIRRLYDLKVMVNQSKIDWDSVVLRSKRYGMNRFVGVTLDYLNHLFGQTAPPQAVRRLVDQPTLGLFHQAAPPLSLFDEKKSTAPYPTMIRQRMLQMAGAPNRLKYIYLMLTHRKASAKWVAALFDVPPDSGKVLPYNAVFLALAIPRYLASKLRGGMKR